MLNFILILFSIYCLFHSIKLFIFLCILNAFIFIWHFFIFRYRFQFHDSDLFMFFGLPGSGKSTVCADIVRQGITKKKFKNIGFFSNFPITGAYELHRDDLGKYDLRTSKKPKSVALIDEASTVYWKRESIQKGNKNPAFNADSNIFFSMHRHMQAMPIFFAQSWDGVDIRIRELSTKLFYVEHSRIRGFIKIRQIAKIFTINEEHQPSDGYDFVKFSSRYVYAPITWKMFDSYNSPPLEKKNWHIWDTGKEIPIKKYHFLQVLKKLKKSTSYHVCVSRGEMGEASPVKQDSNG